MVLLISSELCLINAAAVILRMMGWGPGEMAGRLKRPSALPEVLGSSPSIT